MKRVKTYCCLSITSSASPRQDLKYLLCSVECPRLSDINLIWLQKWGNCRNESPVHAKDRLPRFRQFTYRQTITPIRLRRQLSPTWTQPLTWNGVLPSRVSIQPSTR